MSYGAFLESKTPRLGPSGFEPEPVHESLFGFQRQIVEWAIRRGRAAIFADCGLGKTRMQLEWVRQARSDGFGLIVCPLGVTDQTIAEGRELGLEVRRLRTLADVDGPGIYITNYERLERMLTAPLDWSALVLDESSILKSEDGKTRHLILRECERVPYRLACTATPAPNDIAEMANHAEFVGAMSRVEMLASFFVHDEKGWRLKGHASEAMWQWMASWAVFVRRPSDLGHDDEGFKLPKLSIREVVVKTGHVGGLQGIQGRSKVRRQTLEARVQKTAELVREAPGQWLVWCGLNDEGRELAKLLGDDCVLVEGRDSEADKLEREARWRRGDVRVLISKPKIFGFGMNWQHCQQMAFLGLGDSYEQYYQAIRRCWRFGQKLPVKVRVIVSEAERQIVRNVKAKELEAGRMASSVVEAMKTSQTQEVTMKREAYVEDEAKGEGWALLLGDSIKRIREIESRTVGLSVFSPPFASLYTYSASERDLGNSKNYEQFFEHFAYLLPELLRITKPGRRACVHVQQITTTKNTNGVIGWRDFRADTVAAFTAAGWIYDGEVVIDKCPQAQAIRTKSKALMFVQKNKDSIWSRPAMADYILLFRHPEDNVEPVDTDVTNEEWIRWARPIWYGIRESDTLQRESAREAKDEKHICPLQLETIERCVRLWSNRGDVVFSPFAGIGSEGYVALQHGRRFLGIELKRSYWEQARANLQLVAPVFEGVRGWSYGGRSGLSFDDVKALLLEQDLTAEAIETIREQAQRKAKIDAKNARRGR